MDIQFVTEAAIPAITGKTVLVVPVGAEGALDAKAAAADKGFHGLITAAIALKKLGAKKLETATAVLPAGSKFNGIEIAAVLVVAIGKPQGVEVAESAAKAGKSAPKIKSEMRIPEHVYGEWGGTAYAAASSLNADTILVLVEDALVASSGVAAGSAVVAASSLAAGISLRAYKFEKYKKTKEDDTSKVPSIVVVVDDANGAKAAYVRQQALLDGIFLTRDVVSEPPNVLYPESYANIIQDTFRSTGVKVTVFDDPQLEKMGMMALLGVGRGSVQDSRLAVIEWRGNPSSTETPLALVGKGVTFDTGGISIKPSKSMDEMKWDMGGSGTVVGVMKTLAARKAPVNVVGIVALVENMPDGRAQRPGDVVKSMSGQTIEVLNTDAEGRLILADALWYAQDAYKPTTVIDLATLTGAVISALGYEIAAIMGNDDALCADLIAAGEEVSEPLWRLPLNSSFDKALDSPVADIKNIADATGAGSSIGGQFLARFIKPETLWAHLDIAGVAWSSKDTPLVPKGATAFGVRLLDRYIARFWE